MEIWQLVTASRMSPFSLCPTSLQSLHRFAEFICGGRASTLLSVDPRQGCFYSARRVQAEVSINIKLDVCICGAGRRSLTESWTEQTLLLWHSVPLHYLSILHSEDQVESPIRIFRSLRSNKSQNELYNNSVGMTHASILLFLIK